MTDLATTARQGSPLAQLTPGTWNIDPAHSTVGFVARHLMISKVRGRFDQFSGALTIADNPLDSSVSATVDLTSVETGDKTRDEHLRSPDFFGGDTGSTMEFRSTAIEAAGDEYQLLGDLTIKGVKRPVAFELEFEGVTADPWGGTRAGFSATAEINRKDFGIAWNLAIEAGGVVVGEKIKIQLDIEAVKA